MNIRNIIYLHDYRTGKKLRDCNEENAKIDNKSHKNDDNNLKPFIYDE